jgi:hypothetical protein
MAFNCYVPLVSFNPEPFPGCFVGYPSRLQEGYEFFGTDIFILHFPQAAHGVSLSQSDVNSP